MATYTIPLFSSQPHYEFTTVLDLQTYKITVRWNLTAEAWFMNIKGVSVDVLVNSIALVPGVDLLKPYAIRFLGSMYITDTQGKNEDPDRDSLGSRHLLTYESLE